MLGIFVLLILIGIKEKSRRRALKRATNVSIITKGGLNNDCSDMDLFDEDIPGAANFVTAPSTAGNQIPLGEWP